MTGCFLLRAEAGSSPRRATHFLLLRQKKVSKEKATQLSATPAGQPASVRLRGAPWNSLRAARCTRTTTASQKLKHACPAARMPPRKRPDAGATRWGVRPRAIAALGLQGRARSASPAQGRAQQWPETTPSVCAWGAQGAGWRVCRRTHPHQHLACRSCLSAARSAQRVLRHTPRTSTPGCPAAQRRGRRQQGRLSFGYFSLAKQRRSTSPAGARPGLRPHRRARQ